MIETDPNQRTIRDLIEKWKHIQPDQIVSQESEKLEETTYQKAWERIKQIRSEILNKYKFKRFPE